MTAPILNPAPIPAWLVDAVTAHADAPGPYVVWIVAPRAFGEPPQVGPLRHQDRVCRWSSWDAVNTVCEGLKAVWPHNRYIMGTEDAPPPTIGGDVPLHTADLMGRS